MRSYRIVYDQAAIEDLVELHGWISKHSSGQIAARYLVRIRKFCRQLETFPHRGVDRGDIRPGLRLIGFERRVNIAFEVADDRVVIIRVLYAGRQFESPSR